MKKKDGEKKLYLDKLNITKLTNQRAIVGGIIMGGSSLLCTTDDSDSDLSTRTKTATGSNSTSARPTEGGSMM